MSKINLTYDRISRYLKGLLSNRERHGLEQEMMQDVFDDEAFEGLSQLSGNEFDSDMGSLMGRMDQRLNPEKKIYRIPLFRIAAGILLIAGLGTVLYMLLKPPQVEMITQQVTKEEAPETVIPSAPEIKEVDSRAENGQQGIILKSVKDTEQPSQSVERIEEKSEIVSEEIQGIPKTEEATQLAAPQLSDEYQPLEDSIKEYPAVQYVTGRVLGVNREALAGVSITEKGTTRGTISDIDGNFRLQVKNTGTRLTLSYVGYKQVELPTSAIAGKEISLDEDLVALNEVVVIGYGSRSKVRSDRAAETAKKAQTATPAPYIYSKPVPPGETMLQFEKWVEERIDTDKFMDLLPGNYKIRLTLMINADGSPGNITVKNDVPEVVSEEYKRIVAQSPVWQPALMDKTPVEAEVMIIFSLKVE